MAKFEIEIIRTTTTRRKAIVKAESEQEALDMALKQIDFSTDGEDVFDYEINYIRKIKNQKNESISIN